MVPDDDAPDAFEDDPTHLDKSGPLPPSERDTKTFKSAEFLAGREVGLKDGIEAVIAALRVELVRAGCTEEEITHIVARINTRTQKRR